MCFIIFFQMLQMVSVITRNRDTSKTDPRSFHEKQKWFPMNYSMLHYLPQPVRGGNTQHLFAILIACMQKTLGNKNFSSSCPPVVLFQDSVSVIDLCVCFTLNVKILTLKSTLHLKPLSLFLFFYMIINDLQLHTFFQLMYFISFSGYI